MARRSQPKQYVAIEDRITNRGFSCLPEYELHRKSAIRIGPAKWMTARSLGYGNFTLEYLFPLFFIRRVKTRAEQRAEQAQAQKAIN